MIGVFFVMFLGLIPLATRAVPILQIPPLSEAIDLTHVVAENYTMQWPVGTPFTYKE
jgi:hypothetical protein